MGRLTIVAAAKGLNPFRRFPIGKPGFSHLLSTAEAAKALTGLTVLI